MTTNQNPVPDWTPEPFPEPRTMPEGWHAEALQSRKPAPEATPVDEEWKPEPFPEPRTFPWGGGR